MTTQSANQLKNEYADSQDRLIVDFLAGKLDDRKDDVEAVLGDVLYSECCRHRVSVSLLKSVAGFKDSAETQYTPQSISLANQEDKPSVLYALVDDSTQGDSQFVWFRPGTKVYSSLSHAQVGISLNKLEGHSVYTMDICMNRKTQEREGWERHTSEAYCTTRDNRVLRPDQVIKFRTCHIDRRTLVHEVERLMAYYGRKEQRRDDVPHKFFLRVSDALKNGCGYEVGKLDPMSYCCTIPVRVRVQTSKEQSAWSHFYIDPPLIPSTFAKGYESGE